MVYFFGWKEVQSIEPSVKITNIFKIVASFSMKLVKMAPKNVYFGDGVFFRIEGSAID